MYRIVWDEDAKSELRRLRAFHRKIVVMAIEVQLRHEAEIETANRKQLREPLHDLPRATWELRVAGEHRILYLVDQDKTITILRVILKGRQTTADATGKRKQ
jgi:mRNA-degrading endonuclease RelE of RelBE toxin-antitoxin system